MHRFLPLTLAGRRPFAVHPFGTGAEVGSWVTSDCSQLSLAGCPADDDLGSSYMHEDLLLSVSAKFAVRDRPGQVGPSPDSRKPASCSRGFRIFGARRATYGERCATRLDSLPPAPLRRMHWWSR